jgi:hypothetical protein
MTHAIAAQHAEKSLSSTVGQAIRAGLLLNGLAIALAFTAYKFDYGVSSMPGKISIAIAAICIGVPVLCWLACRSTRKFAMYGWVRLIALLSAYALLGVAFYFFYFIFAPMPMFERIVGLGIGVGLTIYWLIFSYLGLKRHIERSDFENRAFDFYDEEIVCKEKFFKILDEGYVEKNPFVKWHTWLVMALAPFFLVLSRLLSMYFGTGGVLFFIAAVTFPASLWLIGVMVRVSVAMIQLPLFMERKYHKPVLIADNAPF